MRIGILTFHSASNHGAVLQCYALQEVLKNLGYDVKVIDYKQPFIESLYAPISLQHIWLFIQRRHLKGLLSYLSRTGSRAKHAKNYKSIRDRFFRLTKPCERQNIPQDFDTYIIGSDQVWGLHCTNGVAPVYFGDFTHAPSSKIVGYAISSNNKSIESIDRELLKKYTKNFDVLSFREQNIADKVFDKTGVTARVDVDPTLLTNSMLWDRFIDKSWAAKKYVLLYQVRGEEYVQKTMKDKAVELAQRLGCDVVDLSNPQYSTIDFVSAIKYAQSIVTTSFHASVFSIIFERPLHAIVLNDGHDGRYVNILNAIGAQEMLVDINNFIPELKSYDYVEIHKKLKILQEKSLSYLKSL